MKEDAFRGKKEKRPWLASECDNLADAERWRRQVIKEASKKISMIQNGHRPSHMIDSSNL